MKVLVTGGAGFIGSHITDTCIESGYDRFSQVVVCDDLSTGKEENINPQAYFREGDITDMDQMRDIVDFYPDVICHQAAQPSLRKSIDDPVFDAEVNIIGTLNVIKAAKEVGSHLVFASTSAVYDSSLTPPFYEDDTYDPDPSYPCGVMCGVNPNLPYGIAKMAAEQYIRHSGLSYTILRYGNVYGPRQVKVGENQLIPHCLGYLLRGEPFVINGDGEQVRDFVYVKDIARANLMAMEKKPQGTFNCGTGLMYKVNQVCEVLAELHYADGMNWRAVDKFQYGPAKSGEMRASGLNSQKAFDTFGWQAETSLIDGLRMTYEWAKSQ